MPLNRASVDTVHHVYIIKCTTGQYYVGCTNNLKKRLERHQKGQVKSTAYRLPIELITQITFNNTLNPQGLN